MPAAATGLLLAWGLGGVVGNFGAGAVAARLRPLAACAPLLLGAGLLSTALATSLPPLVIGVVVWGIGFNAVPVATQLWVTRVEPQRAESAVSLQVTAFQMALTLGAVAGGALVDGPGVTVTLLAGAAFAAAAALGFALLRIPQ